MGLSNTADQVAECRYDLWNAVLGGKISPQFQQIAQKTGHTGHKKIVPWLFCSSPLGIQWQRRFHSPKLSPDVSPVHKELAPGTTGKLGENWSVGFSQGPTGVLDHGKPEKTHLFMEGIEIDSLWVPFLLWLWWGRRRKPTCRYWYGSKLLKAPNAMLATPSEHFL